MAWKSEETLIKEAVREELTQFGRPSQVYLDMGAEKRLPRDEAAALTTAIWMNLEDRIVALEQKAARA